MTREPAGRGAERPQAQARPWTGAQEMIPPRPGASGRCHGGWALQDVPGRPGTRDSGAAGGMVAASRGPGEYGPAEGGLEEGGPAELWAMLSYLGAIFLWLLAPLAIYLVKRKDSPYVRGHAAQAFNLVITATLFGVACVIVGGLLTLDTPATALVIMIPVTCALWLAMLFHLVRAATAASRGGSYEIPDWLCVRVIR